MTDMTLTHWQIDLTGGRLQLDEEQYNFLRSGMIDMPLEIGATQCIDLHGSTVLIVHRHIECMTQITPETIAHWRRFSREMLAAVDKLDPDGAEPGEETWKSVVN